MSDLNAQFDSARWRGSRVDVCAVVLSMLCLVHCLLLPLLAALLPLAGQLSGNEWAHKLLVLLAAPATLWACWLSLPSRVSPTFMVAALSGLSLLLVAAFVHALAAYEQALTVMGALVLGAAHLWRWNRYRDAACAPRRTTGPAG